MAVAITRSADVAGVGPGTTVSYTGVSIGTASSDRIVVLCVGGERASQTINSATIDFGSGDTAMTALTQANFGSEYSRIFYLPVSTGTTATFKVTFGVSTDVDNNHITVYAVTGAQTTLASSGTASSTDMDATAPLTTGSITIPSNGGFIGLAACADDSTTKTWTNATKDVDADGGTNSFRHTTATSTTGGTVTVTCQGTVNGEDGALSWMIFNPASATLITRTLMGAGI